MGILSDVIFGADFAISTRRSRSIDSLIVFDQMSMNFIDVSRSRAGTSPRCLCSIDILSSLLIPPMTSVFVISSMDFLVF